MLRQDQIIEQTAENARKMRKAVGFTAKERKTADAIRVDLDLANAQINALTALLIDKGVATDWEVSRAINKAVETEADDYEREVKSTQSDEG